MHKWIDTGVAPFPSNPVTVFCQHCFNPMDTEEFKAYQKEHGLISPEGKKEEKAA